MSAYVGSSKEVKDLKGAVGDPAPSTTERPRGDRVQDPFFLSLERGARERDAPALFRFLGGRASVYRGTSLIRKRTPIGPCLGSYGSSRGVGVFLWAR